MNPDIAQAIGIELSHILKPNWAVEQRADHFAVAMPASPKDRFDKSNVDEIWRIARFVAYANFVSIEQMADAKVILTSHLPSGDGFKIIFFEPS